MDEKKITRRNLIMFPLGTVGRDMMYNLVNSYLLTFVLFTRELNAALRVSQRAAEDSSAPSPPSWWRPVFSTR